MYVPEEFEAADPEAAWRLVDAYSFGLLISCKADQPFGSHLPFMADRDRRVLAAHLARANSHWEDLDGRQVMAVFQGPHGYVSPSWYGGAPAVPTWNYAAVHVYGQARIIHDAGRLRDMTFDLARRHEPAGGWDPDDLPDRYIRSMLKGIVGLEIAVERLEAKQKLSQNRPIEDRQRVIGALRNGHLPGDHDLADYMTQFSISRSTSGGQDR